MSHLMAGHPAYEGGWGRSRQAHYLLQLVYIYSFRVKGHHNMEVSVSKSMVWLGEFVYGGGGKRGDTHRVGMKRM